MSYIEKNLAFDSPIQELSIEEINIVFGGDAVPANLPPGVCPDGYKVQSATYTQAGSW